MPFVAAHSTAAVYHTLFSVVVGEVVNATYGNDQSGLVTRVPTIVYSFYITLLNDVMIINLIPKIQYGHYPYYKYTLETGTYPTLINLIISCLKHVVLQQHTLYQMS